MKNEKNIPSHVTISEKETVRKGFLNINKIVLNHERFDGGQNENVIREVMDRGAAVAVLPYDPNTNKVLLIRQFLIGAQQADLPAWPLQVIAGMIDKNENPAETAKREAVEEAGITLKELKYATTYLPSPGGCSEEIVVFIAESDLSNIKSGEIFGLEEEKEDIRVEILDLNDALLMVDTGAITPSPAIISLLWLDRYLRNSK